MGGVAQANIHRDRCAHRNWWLHPWHRAYLYYLERLLQNAVGNTTLFLPSWDWTGVAISLHEKAESIPGSRSR
jgi:Common central domain of tyrosinase